MVNRQDQFFRQEIKEITFFIILGLVMAIIIPIFIGFALGSFEESFVAGKPLEFGSFLVSYIIYYIFIVVALIGLPILKIREMLLTNKGEHPANQKNPEILNVAYLHDPEQDSLLYNLFDSNLFKGTFKKNPMRFSLSMFRMFILAILIFGGLGILQVLSPGLRFVGIPQMPFQVTPFGEVFFSAEPPAFSETMMVIFIFSLLMGFNGYLSSKLKIGKLGYFSIGILLSFVIGILWAGYHQIVYSSSETALLFTFIFGFVGSLLTLIFGSFIMWYVWHFMNNFFIKLVEVVTIKEDIILFAVVIWIALLISYITGEVLVHKYRKKKAEVNVPQ